jgi:hypothetical protein
MALVSPVHTTVVFVFLLTGNLNIKMRRLPVTELHKNQSLSAYNIDVCGNLIRRWTGVAH